MVIVSFSSMVDYPKKQLKQLYENLPKNLQKAVFSDKNGEYIYEACTRNNIEKNDIIHEVAKYTGYVLLGLLSPNDFQKRLEEEVKIEKAKAKQIALEINRFVFFPVKNSLEALYKTTIQTQKDDTSQPIPKKPKRKDEYRESIE